MEYILRTETRTLGGVSPHFRARLIRQVFYYKNLALLKGSEPVKVSTTADEKPIPEDGNNRPGGRDWTTTEQKKIDELMRKWARWEVNFVHRYISSTQCEGMTSNVDKICNECSRVGDDEALKRSIRRVSGLYDVGHRLTHCGRRMRKQSCRWRSNTRFTGPVRNMRHTRSETSKRAAWVTSSKTKSFLRLMLILREGTQLVVSFGSMARLWMESWIATKHSLNFVMFSKIKFIDKPPQIPN